jgi:hypothetical protein
VIKTHKPDASWLRRARAAGMTARTGKTQCPLKKKLLEIGGWAVALPAIEPDLLKILERGGVFAGRSRLVKGETSRCHSNAAALWEANRRSCRICTGYALSRDGMWRQHSWIVTNNEGAIVETTEGRVCYFGFVMTPAECQQFLEDNF